MVRRLHVADYMSIAPHWAGPDEAVLSALKRMRGLGIGYLPILEDERLRGVLVERELALLEAVPSLDLGRVSVAEVMTREPYTVSAATPLGQVARALSAHKYRCAVVIERGAVKGILTTTDVLAALADLVEGEGPAYETLLPSQIRAVVSAEHIHVGGLLDRTERAAQQVADDCVRGDARARELHESTHHLVTAMRAHLELEDRLIAPALAQADGFGDVRSRQLVSEHDAQKRQLEAIVASLDDPAQPLAGVARALAKLAATLRDALHAEELELLRPELLSDDGVVTDIFTG